MSLSVPPVFIKRIIRDIEKLEADLRRIDQKSTPDIVGFYGEMLVWSQLKRHFGWRGYNIKFGSGQSKADIVLVKGGRRINVEVKTSRLKEEWYGIGYGYALNVKKCRSHPKLSVTHPKRGRVSGDFCYFDFLVTVLLSDNLKKKQFYIFPRSFIEKHEKTIRNKNPRFSSATHRIVFPEKPKKSSEITAFDCWLVKNKRMYRDGWAIIE